MSGLGKKFLLFLTIQVQHNLKPQIKIQRWDNSPARQGECPISESNPHAGIKHSTVATPRVIELVYREGESGVFAVSIGSRFASVWVACG